MGAHAARGVDCGDPLAVVADDYIHEGRAGRQVVGATLEGRAQRVHADAGAVGVVGVGVGRVAFVGKREGLQVAIQAAEEQKALIAGEGAAGRASHLRWEGHAAHGGGGRAAVLVAAAHEAIEAHLRIADYEPAPAVGDGGAADVLLGELGAEQQQLVWRRDGRGKRLHLARRRRWQQRQLPNVHLRTIVGE